MKEFNELFNLDEISEVLDDKYRDTETKEIGDRVQVIDYSSVTKLNGEDLDCFDEDMQFDARTYFIVIETRQRVKYDAYYTIYTQDIIMVNPHTKKQYRANQGHLTLIKK